MRWLSHSQVSSYEQCAWKWWASKVLRLSQPPVEPFAFGRSVHAAKAAYWLGNENWPDVLRSTMEQEYKDIDISESGFGKEVSKAEILSRYEQSGIALIQMLTDQIHGTFVQIETIAVERKVKKVGFVGYVDWDGNLDGIRHILDWKTANKSYNPERVHKDDQLTCYAALTGIRRVGYGIMCRSDGSTQLLLSARTKDQINVYWNKVDRIRQEMNSGVYKPSEGWWCGWCAYRDQCPAKGDY